MVADQRLAGQKWDFQPFSVKLRLTPSDKKLENRSAAKGKVSVGLCRVCREEAAAIAPVQRIPLFQLFFDPEGLVCVVSLVSNDPGRLMLKVTEGVLLHTEIERPISPNLPYYRLFVISQPAGPGTVKELDAAAKALERLIDATDTL